MRRFATILLLASAAGAVSAVAALAGVGDWVAGDKAEVRLLVGGPGAEGTLDGGIEIRLAPGWKTYWRSPGAAGIPPHTDFSGSSNLRDVVMHFPVPHRHDDGYAVSNVYSGRVVLPLDIAVADDAKPLDMRLSLIIGVCEEVCIPEHFELALSVPPGITDAKAAMIVAEARANLPAKAEPGIMAVERIARAGGTDRRPEYEVTLTVARGNETDVFVEGPPDWYAAPPELAGRDGKHATYRVRFDRLGARTGLEEARFVVTIVTPERAVEQAVGLD